MFEHLDDPTPPAFDPHRVDRRIGALLHRRHRRQAFASAMAAVVVLAGAAAYTAGRHPSDQRVTTGPTGPALPACAAPGPGSPSLVVYDHPTIQVNWLPSGYRLVSGTAVPPDNADPLTYQDPGTYRSLGGIPSLQVTFDVGISSQDPIPGIRQAYQLSATIDVSGRQASVYASSAFPQRTYIEWNPGPDMAVGVIGYREDLSTLRRVADSITTDLGPPTVITPTSYLGPVISYPQALADLHHIDAKRPSGLLTAGPFSGKLATYAEVRAALGPAESGGTDAADGTPVWLIYDSRASGPYPHPADTSPGSYGIVNARTGADIGAARIPLASLSWVTRVPDHQHVQPCTTPGPATAATTTTTTAPYPFPGHPVTIPDLVGLSATAAGKAAASAGIPGDIESETITSSAPPGTVISQQPPAGSSGDAVALTIAVPAAPPCTAAQLGVTYLGGGASAGSDGATIALRDTSPAWCDLAGPVSVIGTDASGRPVTDQLSPPIPHPLVLSPQAPPPSHGQPTPVGAVYAEIGVSAAYRDLPTGPAGLCTTQQVVPAQWKVTLPLGATATVANHDPSAQPFQEFLTCQGRLEPAEPVRLVSG
ncbi:MAG TPA: PASTA domain-containing protein [Acidimicrobiales bacterium]|nr:PASTA domain-containing protein [Acidimicrobiales bacterium]